MDDAKKIRKPNESGIYIFDNTKLVDVWVNYHGRCHGSDDYYNVIIRDHLGNLVYNSVNIYSQIPSFIVGGSPYYVGKC